MNPHSNEDGVADHQNLTETDSSLPLDAWLHQMYSNMARMATDDEYRQLIAKSLF